MTPEQFAGAVAVRSVALGVMLGVLIVVLMIISERHAKPPATQSRLDDNDAQLIQEVREIIHGKSLASIPHTGPLLNPTPDRWPQ